LKECVNCSIVAPINDEGTVQLLAENRGRRTEADRYTEIERFEYRNKEQLLFYLEALETKQAQYESPRFIRMIGSSGCSGVEHLHPVIPLEQYLERLRNYDLVTIIQERSFTSHMQPIFGKDGTVFGYELLLRAKPGEKPLQPYRLFEMARSTGLHSFLDRQARISAIETSSVHLPRGIKRFINFLPSSIYNPNYCLSHTFEAIRTFRQDPADFVFEVVETEKVDDVEHLKNVFKVYQNNGIKVALDDVGQGYSREDMLKALRPDYVKIDREIIRFCDRDADKQAAIRSIIAVAESFNGIVLAEGIERAEEWDFCRHNGVTLGQGYLLGRPLPRPV